MGSGVRVWNGEELGYGVGRAQQQKSLDSIVSYQQRAGSTRRAMKEAGLGKELEGDSSSPMSKQDSGILHVEDEEELVQIIINTTHLEQSCRYLGEFITNITNVPPKTVQATKLYGTSTFKDARHTAEEEIYTNLNQKIDQFLQLAEYDWMAAQGSDEANDYLSDLIAFLCSTFTVFTHLPGKVAQTACMSACKHLSTSLLQLLLESEVKQISMGALQQFNIDVKECEHFARSGPVPGFQRDTLLLAFIDLRQVGLCLFAPFAPPWDWSTYLADYGRPTCKYLRVNPNTALALLENCDKLMAINRPIKLTMDIQYQKEKKIAADKAGTGPEQGSRNKETHADTEQE
ncbi:Exocyst complex component 6B [Acipenser ruthenus]|uniref:Exocyst complex component 6B n=1 Tax=Acipenser ruthenus TaxID=7906 RepID=A0A444UA52_ACIRT|nr:Exocyst complex component 6B [Acipenser ruthenus]